MATWTRKAWARGWKSKEFPSYCRRQESSSPCWACPSVSCACKKWRHSCGHSATSRKKPDSAVIWIVSQARLPVSYFWDPGLSRTRLLSRQSCEKHPYIIIMNLCNLFLMGFFRKWVHTEYSHQSVHWYGTLSAVGPVWCVCTEFGLIIRESWTDSIRVAMPHRLDTIWYSKLLMISQRSLVSWSFVTHAAWPSFPHTIFADLIPERVGFQSAASEADEVRKRMWYCIAIKLQ